MNALISDIIPCRKPFIYPHGSRPIPPGYQRPPLYFPGSSQIPPHKFPSWYPKPPILIAINKTKDSRLYKSIIPDIIPWRKPFIYPPGSRPIPPWYPQPPILIAINITNF